MALTIPKNRSEKKEKPAVKPLKPLPKSHFGIIDTLIKPVKTSELAFFTSQLALMLQIGTPLHTALSAISKELKNEKFKSVLLSVTEDIGGGMQFSEALGNHPLIFSRVYTSMVGAGEKGSFLRMILDRISVMQTKNQALKTQLRSALTYPMVLSGVGLLVVIFILTSVLPKFTVFFEGKEEILPFTTRFLMAVSDSVRLYWWGYIGIIGFLIALLLLMIQKPMGRKMIDHLMIKLPILAPLMNKIYTGEMLRTLGNLMESKVPLVDALKVTEPTMKNGLYRQFIAMTRNVVEEGGRFSQPFSKSPFLPETVKQMVTVGEEVGKLPVVLLTLADHYETEVDQELKRFSSMIEPIALIFLGAVIGMMVSSIILPMFKIARAIH